MNRILPIIVLGVILVGVDSICLNFLGQIDTSINRIVIIGYWLIFIIATYVSVVWSLWSYGRQSHPRSPVFNLIAGFAFSTMSVKLLMVSFSLLTTLIFSIITLIWSPSLPTSLVSSVIFCGGVILLITMIYGISFGKYNYKVERVKINSERLPPAFNGLKVVQISNIHSGTWDDVKLVKRGIDMIMAESPDLILFTGDLVNTHKDEIDPYIHLFSELTAPMGKYAVLGNHDYMGVPRDESLRKVYWGDLMKKFELMGFNLLLNSFEFLQKDSAQITLAGVENWGDGRFFPKRGDLDMALTGTDPDNFTLLMSHDPSHWEHKVLNHDRLIDLTLSGHTHGMQFGFKFGNFAWSPVKYRYKYWIGRYEKFKRQLYVNRGFGLLAFPGRVGMWPEITVLTLLNASADN